MLFITLGIIYYRIGDSVYDGMSVIVCATIFNMIISYFVKVSIYFITHQILLIFYLLYNINLTQFIKLIKVSFEKMYSAKDERVSLSKDVMDGMKSIKYLGWEKIFLNKINLLRKKEYKHIFNARLLDGFLTIFF